MSSQEVKENSKRSVNVTMWFVLLAWTFIVGMGMYIFIYWNRDLCFPWEISKGVSDYKATTDLEATQDMNNVVDGLVENVKESNVSDASDSFSPLPYGDIVAGVENEDGVTISTFTLKGLYKGYNEKTQQVILQLAKSSDILAIGKEDVGSLYFFPSEITQDIVITNAGIAVKPDSRFPFLEEEKTQYKVEDVKEIPLNVDVLVYGTLEGKYGDTSYIYKALEFYEK